MTLNNIWDTIKENPGWITCIIILLFSLVEISKIKLNPWSAIGRGIGKFLGVKAVSDKVDAINQKVEQVELKIDDVDKKVDDVDDKVEEGKALSARARILRFGVEVSNHINHDKGMWDNTMADIENYNKYVECHKEFKNGITEPTAEYLTELYKERLRKGDWEKGLTKRSPSI